MIAGHQGRARMFEELAVLGLLGARGGERNAALTLSKSNELTIGNVGF
jgi:hypothetical protein